MRYEQGDWVRWKEQPARVQWVTSDGFVVGIKVSGERETREVVSSSLRYVFKS